MELSESPTTKDLKKKYLSRLVGRVEMVSQGGGDSWTRWQLADKVVPHLPADKLGGTTGERDRLHNPGFWREKRKPQNL